MFHIVLYQPEIPPNTGNIIRLSANVGARLHLVQPLGFELSDKTLARAGLDYIPLASLRVHEDWNACQAALQGARLFAVTTRGRHWHAQTAYAPGDAFVFGPESRGLPQSLLAGFEPAQQIRIPMRPGNRSMNLSNAVAVMLYEAWRQTGFEGAA
jgi:tRNA (cytidine/uridine-2'-O-)-methyltransferase